jgi:hypothetical protein
MLEPGNQGSEIILEADFIFVTATGHPQSTPGPII